MNARCASTVKDPMYHFTWERWTGRLPHANFDRCSPDQAPAPSHSGHLRHVIYG